MTMQKQNFIYKLINVIGLLLAGVVVLCAFIISLPKNMGELQYSSTIILTFIVNAIVCFIGFLISIKRYKYSFEIIFWIFNFFFFFLAPFIQYLRNSFPWEYTFTNRLLVKTNLLILAYIVVFVVVYNITINKQISKPRNYKRPVVIKQNSFAQQKENKALLILSLLSLFYIVLFCVKLNITDLFSKYTVEKAWNITSSRAINLIFMNCSIYFVGIIFLFNVKEYMTNKKINVGMICSLCSFCVVCFPLALTRYVVAIIYLSLLIYLFEKHEISGLFPSLLILAIVLIFPIMGSLSHLNASNNNIWSLIKDVGRNVRDMYLSADYDAYANFAKAIKYVETNGITFGWQLLGCLLFFIPRSWWAEKPVGSGAFVADKMGMTFTNISMPWAGEGFINFGFLGMCGFSGFIAYVSAKMDVVYWEKNNKFVNGLYPMILVLFFFLYRGDLMSSYSTLISILFIYFAIYSLVDNKIFYKIFKVKKCE